MTLFLEIEICRQGGTDALYPGSCREGASMGSVIYECGYPDRFPPRDGEREECELFFIFPSIFLTIITDNRED